MAAFTSSERGLDDLLRSRVKDITHFANDHAKGSAKKKENIMPKRAVAGDITILSQIHKRMVSKNPSKVNGGASAAAAGGVLSFFQRQRAVLYLVRFKARACPGREIYGMQFMIKFQ